MPKTAEPRQHGVQQRVLQALANQAGPIEHPELVKKLGDLDSGTVTRALWNASANSRAARDNAGRWKITARGKQWLQGKAAPAAPAKPARTKRGSGKGTHAEVIAALVKLGFKKRDAAEKVAGLPVDVDPAEGVKLVLKGEEGKGRRAAAKKAGRAKPAPRQKRATPQPRRGQKSAMSAPSSSTAVVATVPAAVEIVHERSFRCAVFSDGGFMLAKGGVQIDLTAGEHGEMLRYLERMAEHA